MRFVLITLLLVACHNDNDAEPYPTFQECFDDHHNVEALPVQEAIVVCCLDHPIAGVKPVCGDTAAACGTYLDANLSATSASGTDKTAACADYINKKGM